MLDNKVSLHSYLKSPCMIATAENLYLDTIIVLSLYYTLQKHLHALVPRERNICLYKTLLFSLISTSVATQILTDRLFHTIFTNCLCYHVPWFIQHMVVIFFNFFFLADYLPGKGNAS